MSYGPRLTKKQRAALLAEIKAFDFKATKALIEREAVGGKDINAYEDWRKSNPGEETVQANPDSLTEDCATPWKEAYTPDLLGLSRREKEAWEYCELAGLSYEEAAERMGVSPVTINTLIVRAKRKLRGNK